MLLAMSYMFVICFAIIFLVKIKSLNQKPAKQKKKKSIDYNSIHHVKYERLLRKSKKFLDLNPGKPLNLVIKFIAYDTKLYIDIRMQNPRADNTWRLVSIEVRNLKDYRMHASWMTPKTTVLFLSFLRFFIKNTPEEILFAMADSYIPIKQLERQNFFNLVLAIEHLAFAVRANKAGFSDALYYTNNKQLKLWLNSRESVPYFKTVKLIFDQDNDCRSHIDYVRAVKEAIERI